VSSRELAHRSGPAPAQLADVLERVLDKGIVIAGDIQINLLDIELLTVKLRLLVASADKAREMGIDWWENDPFLSSSKNGDDGKSIDSRLRALEEKAGLPTTEKDES
jgi:gas vesicle protein GvpA/GvpJ/GvpM family